MCLSALHDELPQTEVGGCRLQPVVYVKWLHNVWRRMKHQHDYSSIWRYIILFWHSSFFSSFHREKEKSICLAASLSSGYWRHIFVLLTNPPCQLLFLLLARRHDLVSKLSNDLNGGVLRIRNPNENTSLSAQELVQMCHRSALCATPQILLCEAVSCFLVWETFTAVFSTGMWHGRKLISGAPHWLPTTIWNMGIRTGPRAKPQMAQTKNKAGIISSFGICSADLSDLHQEFRTERTCCETEKPMMMSPSGTSQDTVAESARRCMTDTLTGAGGRSEREETGGSVVAAVWISNSRRVWPNCTGLQVIADSDSSYCQNMFVEGCEYVREWNKIQVLCDQGGIQTFV